MKITKSRLGSDEVSSKTIHGRCLEMASVRELISSGSSPQQLAEEVRTLSSEERQRLLTDAGFSIDIATNKGLAMKADLALPWNKLRVIRRYVCSASPRQIAITFLNYV